MYTESGCPIPSWAFPLARTSCQETVCLGHIALSGCSGLPAFSWSFHAVVCAHWCVRPQQQSELMQLQEKSCFTLALRNEWLLYCKSIVHVVYRSMRALHIFTITVVTVEFGVVRVRAFSVLQEILQKQSVPLRRKKKSKLVIPDARNLQYAKQFLTFLSK